uniref:Hypothetical chloroplast RF19 n=1 Tax=Templetonia retusa TaxID=140951 RepID=A0A6H0EF18_9FABA|nr:hypothetical chloroplast RF19 [Templetonia retusa]QIT00513.1 hypothetical chloroplast RF19 [Templetonia retusa]
MIFQSLILDNLVSLCMKIMNSVIVVGLYYGFMTTFSVGPYYLFLLRARVMEEGTKKKVSATIGFVTGQLIMFISIYYAPLHLALGRPYTITVIALPYLLFHFFGNNHKHFLNYGYKNPNSIRNWNIQRIFFNNLIFQLLNPLILPSPILVRLVNIYMFRFQWNKKFLFLASNFVGWLIGHTFLMKWIEFILVWIQQNFLIQYNVSFGSKSNKYIMSEFQNYMPKIFIVSLFITCLYYLGRTPSPFFTKKLSEIQERNEIEKKIKIDVKKTSETARTKQEFAKENISVFPEKQKKKNILGFQKPVVTFLFDYKRWNRPLRYIKNDQFENVIRNEISEFFFHTCQSDGKERISFIYPPNLSTFLKMIETKISFFPTEKLSYDELSNYWSSTNEEKRKKQTNEFINRAKALDKAFYPPDLFEKQIRLCNDETQIKYLPKIYDPFLNGPCRGRIKEGFLTSMKNETYKKNDIWINKIHGILLTINSNTNYNINSNYRDFEQKTDTFDRKSLLLLTEIHFFLNLISTFSGKSVSSLNLETLYLFREHKKIDSKKKKRKMEFLFDAIRTDLNEKTIVNRKKWIGIKEISKKVPRWSYKLIDELEQLGGKNERDNYGIRSRKAKRVVIFTNKAQKDNTYSDIRNTDKKKELALIRYSQQPDFRRDIIKGSIRAQRRKTVTSNFLQKSLHSPIFLDKIEKPSLLSLEIFEPMKIFFMFKNRMWEKKELKISDYKEEKTKESEKKEEDKIKKKEKEEKRRIEIAEAWDSIIFAQVIRGFLLISQSILRKYIILPSLIITKNIARMLLFKFPEWSEDFRDWNREMYIRCTYNGIQLSEREFPKKWLTDGIQIKILFPFRLKPWHRSKLRSSEKKKDPMKNKKEDFCFLTIWGMEVELPFSGYPRNRLSFFDPIFKELKKKMNKLKKFIFLVLKVLNERTKLFLNVSKDTVKWMIKNFRKSILFLNKKRKQLKNLLFLFSLKKENKLSEIEKKNISKNNRIIYKSPIPIQSINCTNSSLTEKKRRDMNVKTKTIQKQIQKKRAFLTSEINISSKKTTFHAKRLRFEFKKKFLQILQRKNARVARKWHSFFKFFMERVYIDIFLRILSIRRINVNVQFFFELSPKIQKNSIYHIYHNEANAERTDKTNQSIIHFIKIIKKFPNIGNMNSQNELSSLSQAYVFFKLSQTKVINTYKYKLRSIFEYHRRSFFLKNKIKNSLFGVHGIFYSKLRHNNPTNFVMNQWTNWLKGHSQYHLSQSRWARLVPEKWRNKINEGGVAPNKYLKKCDLYEKPQLILYKKQQIDSLRIQKKVKKQYGYHLLSYKSINYADKKDSYIYGYRSSFQANQKQAIYYNYNYNTRKQKLFDLRLRGNISITNYIAEGDSIYMEKNLDRRFFDWMEMNVKTSNRSISDLEFLFFSKFVTFYNAYTNNPWIIPINLLFFNLNVTKDVSENTKITAKKEIIDIFKPSKKKKSSELELETRNQAKTKYAGRVDSESSLSNQEKDIEQDSVGSDGTKDKGIKKKKYKNKIETELSLLLKKYSGFQLNWKGSLNQRIMSNIKVYCLLIRLKNIKEIAITSIQRGELSLDVMVIQSQKDFTLRELGKKKELLKKGILIIEPVRLSRKNDEQFIMYQTIVPSLIHKSKRQINQRYPEKSHVNKKNFEKSITEARDQKITKKKEKKHYDYDLLVPENILSARRRRELRILNCFNPQNRNSVHINTMFYNENKVNNCCQVLAKNKNLNREKKKLMNFKFFLWPNYRLEDLACMNRYWFYTNNGSRFSIVRIHIYPRLKRLKMRDRSTLFFCSIYRNIFGMQKQMDTPINAHTHCVNLYSEGFILIQSIMHVSIRWKNELTKSSYFLFLSLQSFLNA